MGNEGEGMEMKTFYIDWLDEERLMVNVPIKDIYCKHESVYRNYRNNYFNQYKELYHNFIDEKFAIERERNKRLSKILNEQGSLYPIALHEYYCKDRPDANRNPYMCVDGHHRIMAYINCGYNSIPGIIYKDCDEAGLAKANAPHTDYYEDLMNIEREIGNR